MFINIVFLEVSGPRTQSDLVTFDHHTKDRVITGIQNSWTVTHYQRVGRSGWSRKGSRMTLNGAVESTKWTEYCTSRPIYARVRWDGPDQSVDEKIRDVAEPR